MQRFHTPRVDPRYWTAITLASIFGTNLGDFYAHESGLGIGKGLAVLTAIACAAFVIEGFDHWRHQVYYWLVIILIRTGATNIADYLAFRVRVPPIALTLSLVVLLCLFAWGNQRSARSSRDAKGLPDTNALYWCEMLTAGVFGTVVGDICSHAVGQGVASLGLGAILLMLLVAGKGRAARVVYLYWATVAVARTAGTAMGDWLAENKVLHLGLSVSTLMTGTAFVAVLVLWRSKTKAQEFIGEPVV